MLRIGPLRPRLPSFEPVMSAEEVKQAESMMYEYQHQNEEGNYSPDSLEDDHDKNLVTCDIIWSTLLAASG